MSKRSTVIYTCNICGKTTENPELFRWFKIENGILDGYLCESCFHNDEYEKFNRWLYMLGIEIVGKSKCTQYSENKELGFIVIDSVRLNNDDKDHNRIKIGRRVG